MAEREAIDADMLAAVERLARVTGRWWVDVNTRAARLVRIERGRASIWNDSRHVADVDAHTALLWIMLEHAGLTIDVGPCPACVKRGSSWEYTDSPLKPPNGPGGEWEYLGVGVKGLPDGVIGGIAWERCTWRFDDHWYRRACRSCLTDVEHGYPDRPTGRDVRTLAQLVLDASPIDCQLCDEHGCELCGEGKVWSREGIARDRLAVEADRRIATGSEQTADFYDPDSYAEAEKSGRSYVRQRGGTNIREVNRWRLEDHPGFLYHVELAWTEPDPIGARLALWLAGSREGTQDMVDELNVEADRIDGGDTSAGMARRA